MTEPVDHDAPEIDVDSSPRRLDGNALAGPLLEMFAADLSHADVTCNHCGSTSPLATHHLYPHGPAMVLRCHGCSEVLLRFGSAGGRTRLDLTGTRLLAVDTPADAQPR